MRIYREYRTKQSCIYSIIDLFVNDTHSAAAAVSQHPQEGRCAKRKWMALSLWPRGILSSVTERRKGESLISSSESLAALSPDDTHASVSNVHPRQNRKKIERDVIEFSECAHCNWTFDPPSGSSTFSAPASSAEFPQERSWML